MIDLLMRRREMVKKASNIPYDAEVEYLEASGQQYIDTGFKHNQDTRIVCKITFDSSVPAWTYPFGSFGGASGAGKLFAPEVYSDNKFRTYYGSQKYGYNIAAAGTHSFDLNKNVHKIDYTYHTYSAETFSSQYNLLIFGVTHYNGNVSAQNTPKKLYYFQIYDNGTLVRDYIPVRKGGVGYLYDRVSRQLFGNDGDGNFAYGNDKLTYTSNPYVTNGLIYQLDGEYNDGFGNPHRFDKSSWKEIVNGADVTPTAGSLDWYDKFDYFNGSTQLTISTVNSDIIQAINNDTIRVEMVLMPRTKGASTNNAYLYLGNSVRGIWLWDASGSTYSSWSYRQNSYKSIGKNAYLNLNRIVITPKNLNIDGTNYADNHSGTVTNSDCYIAGGLGHAVYFLYSIRIYNRLLTEEEILQNKSVDTLRFGTT